jgi:hypothetical protein
MSDEQWRLTCTRDAFAALREDADFLGLLRLARAANALRFGLAVLTEGREDGTAALRRRRLNAYMMLAGTVHETLRLAAGLAPARRDSPAWTAGFGALFDDPGAIAYAEAALGAVHARAPFSFDAVPQPALPRPGDDAVFGAGDGRTPGAFHYALADEALLADALDVTAPTGAPFYDAMKEHMESAALLAERCAESVDRLIAEGLRAQPWRIEGGD